MVKIVLVGGIAERKGFKEVDVPLKSRTVKDLLKALSNLVPEAVNGNGRLRPGFLVFINGVDVRVLAEEDSVDDSAVVHVVQVYHGGG